MWDNGLGGLCGYRNRLDRVVAVDRSLHDEVSRDDEVPVDHRTADGDQPIAAVADRPEGEVVGRGG